MLWVFGFIFLAFVAVFAKWLGKDSASFIKRASLVPRLRRTYLGIALFALGSVFAALALLAVRTPAAWSAGTPPVLEAIGVLICMCLFAIFQVFGCRYLISLAVSSETADEDDRS